MIHFSPLQNNSNASSIFKVYQNDCHFSFYAAEIAATAADIYTNRRKVEKCSIKRLLLLVMAC
jgi:hypothetical protein